MQTILATLTSLFQQAALSVYPELGLSQAGDQTEVTVATNSQFGHYQYNSAMKIAKSLKKNPRLIAQEIANQIADHSMIASLEIAGPGFINIILSAEFLSQSIDLLLRSSSLISLPPTQKIIIDFSSPNVAKEMHVGHLRSTIIGDCLARLFEYLGHNVLRLNHIGDWGTAFGMLIAYIEKQALFDLQEEKEVALGQLMAWYKSSKKEFDENPEFKKQAQLKVVALQNGEEKSLQIWRMICGISQKAYQEIYDLLDVHLHTRGESFYNPLLSTIVKDLEDKGLIQESQGAKCIFLPGFVNRDGQPLPLMVQKSDGGYNYATTDLAAIRHRIEEEKADRIIYVTDAGQALHFQMIFETAKQANYLNPTKVRVDHVPFGLVLGADGKKFRTRSGETEKLADLLSCAVQRADQILQEKDEKRPVQERQELAHALGIGAVKYADLSSHRVNDYTFSYDRMLRFEGNTAAFLMYAYVRIAGIKRRLNVDPKQLMEKFSIQLKHSSEIALGLHLLRFEEVLQLVVEELLPHRLTDYLYQLAEKFHAFFRDCRVEGAAEQNERLLLCEITSKVLKQGLTLLGLKVVERM